MTRIFLLSVCWTSAIGTFGVIGALRAESPERFVEFWLPRRDLMIGHSVKYQRIENGELYESGELHCRNEFVLLFAERPSETTVRIENPAYKATIAKREKEEYRIRWLGNQQAISESANVLLGNIFFMQVCDPCAAATVAANPELTQGIEPLQSGAGVAYTIISPLPDDSGIHPAYAGARVRILGVEGKFPELCEILLSAEHGGGGTRLKYLAPLEMDGRQLPATVIATSISKFDDNGENPSEYHYDYSVMNDEFDTDRCYLRHYGLPEPEASSSSAVVLIFWILCIAGTLAVVVIVRRRFA